MTTPNFDSLTTDELVAYKRDVKGEIDQLRDKARAANEVYTQRIDQQHIDEATRQVESAAQRKGVTPKQQAISWLAENADDPGHRVHAARYLLSIGDPDYAHLSMNPHRTETADVVAAYLKGEQE